MQSTYPLELWHQHIQKSKIIIKKNLCFVQHPFMKHNHRQNENKIMALFELNLKWKKRCDKQNPHRQVLNTQVFGDELEVLKDRIYFGDECFIWIPHISSGVLVNRNLPAAMYGNMWIKWNITLSDTFLHYHLLLFNMQCQIFTHKRKKHVHFQFRHELALYCDPPGLCRRCRHTGTKKMHWL